MIIGLCGLAGSGKSEVAEALRQAEPLSNCMPFAGPLKDMLEAVGFTHSQLYGGEKATPIPEIGGMTPRHLMQTLGTDWAREMVHPDFWVRMWERKADTCHDRLIIADDVRFANEAEAIRRRGGQVWRIIRPGVVPMAHKSETADFEPDVVIHNDADLFELRCRAVGHLFQVVAA